MRLGTYYRWLLSKHLGLLPDPHERVLDVGCYDGYLLSRIECRTKIAVDLEPAMAPYSPVWKADGHRLPFADEEFDRVYLLDVIEHVHDYQVLLEEADRVLRPGGTLWISTPSLHWWVFPPFLTQVLDRKWGHVRRGHEVEDIQTCLAPSFQLYPRLWSMPCFRLFYFPTRLLWNVWPALARRILTWVSQCDQQAPPGRAGHLFIRAVKNR